MSDIHGCIAEFEEALSLIWGKLPNDDVMLILMGDYIHGGADNRAVLDKIMRLQERYGYDKVVALRGNHEEWVLEGQSTIDHMIAEYEDGLLMGEDDDEKYLAWIEKLPLYYTAGNTIFVHAGIDEDAGDLWEWGTDEWIFTSQYPASVGQIPNLEMKVVAGHVGTAEISGDPRFHEIFYDGASHYYIDGTVLTSGIIPVLLVDTDTDTYYQVTEAGEWVVEPYESWRFD